MTNRYEVTKTVQIQPGADVPIRLPSGAGILVESVLINTNCSWTNAVAWAGGAKTDAPGHIYRKVSLDYNGQIRQAPDGWFCWAGNPERAANYAAAVIGSTTQGIGRDPEAAAGPAALTASHALDFSTIDGERPKDSALDMDVLGQGGEASVILSVAQIADLYQAGAGSANAFAGSATVTIRYIREDGVRGRDWTPPMVYKRVQMQGADLSVAGEREIVLPRGGKLRSVTMRLGTSTGAGGIALAAATNWRIGSAPDTWVDRPIGDLLMQGVGDFGRRPIPYYTWDACQQGGPLSRLADCRDTVNLNRDPKLQLTAAGLANTSARLAVVDYVAV